MDYKYIEALLDRYFEAETTLEEEGVLRSFFSQSEVPAELEQWRALFVDDGSALGDDFDERLLAMTVSKDDVVQAKRVSIMHRLQPLFKAAAVIAILLTIGGALQAPWDNSWNTIDDDYAALQLDMDSMMSVQPIQAENMSDVFITDSTNVLMHSQSKN